MGEQGRNIAPFQLHKPQRRCTALQCGFPNSCLDALVHVGNFNVTQVKTQTATLQFKSRVDILPTTWACALVLIILLHKTQTSAQLTIPSAPMLLHMSSTTIQPKHSQVEPVDNSKRLALRSYHAYGFDVERFGK